MLNFNQVQAIDTATFDLLMKALNDDNQGLIKKLIAKFNLHELSCLQEKLMEVPSVNFGLEFSQRLLQLRMHIMNVRLQLAATTGVEDSDNFSHTQPSAFSFTRFSAYTYDLPGALGESLAKYGKKCLSLTSHFVNHEQDGQHFHRRRNSTRF